MSSFRKTQYLLMGMDRHHHMFSDTLGPLWGRVQVVVNRAHIDRRSCMWQKVPPASGPEAE